MIVYRTAHSRVTRARGKASDHACSHCEETAAEWAYDHTDPNALHDQRGRPYSEDIWRYLPLCRLCHHVFDGRSLDPCGTVNAYQRHFRRGEEPCSECRAASAAYVARQTAKRKARAAANNGLSAEFRAACGREHNYSTSANGGAA